MYDQCRKEVAGGRVPLEIEFVCAVIPEELRARLIAARRKASSEFDSGTLLNDQQGGGSVQCSPDRGILSCPMPPRQPHGVNLDGARHAPYGTWHAATVALPKAIVAPRCIEAASCRQWRTPTSPFGKSQHWRLCCCSLCLCSCSGANVSGGEPLRPSGCRPQFLADHTP
jgi:hypothetical protein